MLIFEIQVSFFLFEATSIKRSTYLRVNRSLLLCSTRSGMQWSSSSQPFQNGSCTVTTGSGSEFDSRTSLKESQVTDGASPRFSPQWANCHPEPARPQSPGAPLGLQTRWAWHSQWSPGERFGQQVSVGNTFFRSMAFQYALYLCKKCEKRKKKFWKTTNLIYNLKTLKEAISGPSRSLVIIIIIFLFPS